MFGFFKERRRKRLRSAPFPPAWLEIITETSPFTGACPKPIAESFKAWSRSSWLKRCSRAAAGSC